MSDVHDDDDRIVMDPDEGVCDAIATVLRLLDELGSARQVMLNLQERGLLVPRRATGSRTVTGAAARYPAMHDWIIESQVPLVGRFCRDRAAGRVGRLPPPQRGATRRR